VPRPPQHRREVHVYQVDDGTYRHGRQTSARDPTDGQRGG
jgi:hypothetical protein